LFRSEPSVPWRLRRDAARDREADGKLVEAFMNAGKKGPAILAIVAGAALLGACNHVNRDEFNDTVAELRSQMESQDARIGQNGEQITGLRADVDGLKAALDQLRKDFQVRIDKLEDGMRFATPVHFDFDESDIRAVDEPFLNRFASVVKQYYPDAKVTVEGFADPAGSRAYNKRLSQKRAQNVAAYLEGQGLDPSRVGTVGYGETRLVDKTAEGPGDAGMENRRVAFVVEYSPTAAASMSASSN